MAEKNVAEVDLSMIRNGINITEKWITAREVSPEGCGICTQVELQPGTKVYCCCTKPECHKSLADCMISCAF